MSAEKEVVYAGDRHYGDKIAKAIDEISEATNAALLKELEATKAELAAEREKCMLIAQDLKWENQLSLKLQESKAELEAAKAELAAERAKPRGGGVAWALKQHGFKGYLGRGDGVLYLTKNDAESERRTFPHPDVISVVPHVIGGGAGELKDALTAKEKAEAEVAAWKAAARHRYQDTIPIESPDDLIRRIDNLKYVH